MKILLNALLAASLCTFFSNAFAESYTVTSNPGALTVKATLQGGGAIKINDKNIGKIFSNPDPDLWVRQTINLNADHTLDGTIETNVVSFLPGGIVYNLSGTWYRPAGSNVIYIAPDGDATNADQDNAGYGNLFNPMNTFFPVDYLLSMAFLKKVTMVSPIYASLKFSDGIIKLKLDKNGTATSATSIIKVSGHAMTTYCKMKKNGPCNLVGPKDAAFSIGTTAKNTLNETP